MVLFLNIYGILKYDFLLLNIIWGLLLMKNILNVFVLVLFLIFRINFFIGIWFILEVLYLLFFLLFFENIFLIYLIIFVVKNRWIKIFFLFLNIVCSDFIIVFILYV